MKKTPLNRSIITVQNKTSECARLSAFLANYLKANNITEKIYHDLRLVIEETFVNITNHAFLTNENHSVSIELSNSGNTINITFIDSGMAFNPLTDALPETEKTFEVHDHCEGGMGIHIIKSLTDKQEYSRIDQRNVFTVTKHYTTNETNEKDTNH
jgi:anti-sigma regulatory factor (Ser/Thr protein kinase)